MLISWVSSLNNGIEATIHPESEDLWESDHLNEKWIETHEPEKELQVGTWHERDAAHVADDQDFCCLSGLGQCFDAKILVRFESIE
jgi:hypothetical protein